MYAFSLSPYLPYPSLCSACCVMFVYFWLPHLFTDPTSPESPSMSPKSPRSMFNGVKRIPSISEEHNTDKCMWKL